LFLLNRYYDQTKADIFAKEILGMADRLNCSPEHLIMVLFFESSLHPHAQTANGSGTGFIQLTSSDTLKLGTTTTRLLSMDGVTQLRYIEKHLTPYKPHLNSLTELYFACFYPDGVNASDEYYFRFPTRYKTANSTFPLRNLNRIQKWEVDKALRRYFIRMGWEGV
jgi:hypothetical protein